MKKICHYKCTLLSDVILTSMATTEGYKESLNYISGAKFMGIVASKATKLYDEKAIEATLDLFHNGTVHFGDATPMIQNSPTYKVPFSWFYKKGGKLSDALYLHHNIVEDKTIQLKQVRDGYFSTAHASFASLDQRFSIKSAYDILNRKSKDSQMYGYFSLKKGTAWAFSVEDAQGEYSERIKNILIGKHKIGKSKSAEYGLVDIQFLSETTDSSALTYSNDVLIYAQSNLCFYDDFGVCTALPDVVQLVGTPNAEILWEKSQVRSRNYQTWNGKRNNRDADRLIIESGSVFFVRLKTPITSTFFEQGIGAYRNEGFGKILVNPAFLLSDSETLSLDLTKGEVSSTPTVFYAYDGDVTDDYTITCLNNRQKVNDFSDIIDQKVNQFEYDFKPYFTHLSKSQWGVLRTFAKNSDTIVAFKNAVLEENGFLYRGKSEAEWRKNGRRDKLKTYLQDLETSPEGGRYYLPFVVKLSNQMAKIQ